MSYIVALNRISTVYHDLGRSNIQVISIHSKWSDEKSNTK